MGSFKTPVQIIRYEGLFDFENLYRLSVDWCKSNRYWFHEETYKHKVPTPFGAEQELWWKMEKKVTEYIKFDLQIRLHLWEMTEVEVVKDGKKKRLTKARVQIDMYGKVTYDWQNKLTGSKLKDLMGKLLSKYVWKKELTTVYGDMVYYRLQNFHTLVKKYFDMQTAWNEYVGYLRESM